jgi:DNA primase catalytic core
MARIPDAEVQRLKDEVAVQRLVEAAGIELKRVGKDWAGHCPFHEDGEPSLIVTPAKNLWHCFGCQVGGGPIDWVMKLKGVSFRHAVELLKDESALRPGSGQALAAVSGEPVKRTTVRTLPPPVSLDADDRALLVQVVDYYRQTLKQSPEALAYLQARGLNHPELVDHFQLGYANRTLGLRLADKRRVEGAQMRARLERLGVYRASGHEHFAGSLVVPVLDEHGQVREVYGRKIGERLRAGTPLHLYLPAHETRGVFNVQALKAAKEVILCEAIIDALTFWCAGYRNVTTAYGVEGFTEELMAAFKANGVQRVLIAYDRDEAGERAAQKLAPQLQAAGIEVWRIEFPKGMDANEYAQKVQPATKSLGLLIRKAAWMGKGQAPEPPNSRQQQEDRPAPPPLAAESAPAAPAVAPVVPAAPELPAVRVPEAAPVEPVAEVDGREVMLSFGEGAQARRWRVRGLAKNLAYEVLKVNVLVVTSGKEGDAFHVDTFDLYAARARAAYLAQAAAELRLSEEVLKADLGRMLLKLEALQDEAIQTALRPKAAALPTMTADEHMAALDLLNAPDLPARILADFEAVGVVGEATNKLVGYLAAVSRKLDRPLAVVIQSSSAAGKSSLMDAVLAFVPEEERVQYSAMTGQSLFYMGQTNLKHKILAIAEEEGAHRASYALKLLQSEGELTIASTGTDPATGNLITQEYKVEGPMSLFMTTTAIDIDEELMNRCLVLSVDEAREQTRAIHKLQRERRTLAGLTRKHERQAILQLHRNAQRLLRPLAVVNPWADQLTFLDDRTRTRRDHDKYLTLIDAIALLHQHQRPIKSTTVAGQIVEYIEATVADIELANALAHEVLGTSLDELPPQTRRVLVGVRELVRARMAEQGLPQREVRFTRGELRAATGASDTQLKVHLARLAELEYLLVHRAPRGQGFVYELLYDGDALATQHLSGLIDTAALKTSGYDARRSAAAGQRSGSGRGAVGGQSAPGQTLETVANPHAARPVAELGNEETPSRATPGAAVRASYLQSLAA